MSQRAGRLQSQGQYQLSEKAIIEAIDRQAIEQDLRAFRRAG